MELVAVLDGDLSKGLQKFRKISLKVLSRFFFTWKFIYFLATGLFCTLKFYFAPVFFFLYLDVFVFVFLHLDVFVVVFLHLEVEPEDGRLQPVLVLDQRVMPQSVRIGLKIGFNWPPFIFNKFTAAFSFEGSIFKIFSFFTCLPLMNHLRCGAGWLLDEVQFTRTRSPSLGGRLQLLSLTKVNIENGSR